MLALVDGNALVLTVVVLSECDGTSWNDCTQRYATKKK